jgi:hypothetical protein
MFSFVTKNSDFARVTMGWPEKFVSESRLSEARIAAIGAWSNACPIAVSYLGEMTREEATS